MTEKKDTVIFLGLPLVVTGFTASLFFQGLTDPWFAVSYISLIGFGLVVLFDFKSGTGQIPRSVISVFLFLWWGLLGVSLFWTEVLFNSQVFFFTLSIFPFLFFMCLMTSHPDQVLRACLIGLFICVGGLSVSAAAQFFVWYDIYGPRIHLPFHNPNTLGGLFVLSLLPLVGLYFKTQIRQHQVMFLISALVVLMGLLVTQSRGAVLAGCVAFGVVLYIARSQPDFLKKCLVLLTFGAGVVLVFYLSGGTRLPAHIESFMTLQSENSTDQRLAIWSASWQMIKDHPWLGTGLGTFYLYYPPYRLVADVSSGLWAHSDPLQFWLELGIMGPVLFYATLIGILFRTIKACRKAQCALPIIIPFSGLLALVLHAHVTFHLYQPSILILSAVMLAFWYHETEKVMGLKPARQAVPKMVLCASAIVVLVFSAVWLARAGYAVHLSHQARTQLAAGDLEKFSKTADRLYHISPPSYAPANLFLAEFHSAILRVGGIPLTPEQFSAHRDQAFDLLADGAHLNPKEPMFKHARATLLLALGDAGEARALWEQILKDNPQHFESRLALARLYDAEGRRRAALDLLKAGLVWPPLKDATAYYDYVLRLARGMADRETEEFATLQKERYTR